MEQRTQFDRARLVEVDPDEIGQHIPLPYPLQAALDGLFNPEPGTHPNRRPRAAHPHGLQRLRNINRRQRLRALSIARMYMQRLCSSIHGSTRLTCQLLGCQG